MKIDHFNQVVNDQVAYSLSVLAEKGKEYSLSADRLDHFKDAAIAQGITPKQALWGMLTKHIASLNGMCRNGSDSEERWTEKITDSINYLLLLRALVEEDFDNEEKRPYRTKTSQLVNLYTLEIGTRFYVCNGAWTGQIVTTDSGQKAVYINETGKTFVLTPESGADHEIEVSRFEMEDPDNEKD